MVPFYIAIIISLIILRKTLKDWREYKENEREEKHKKTERFLMDGRL